MGPITLPIGLGIAAVVLAAIWTVANKDKIKEKLGLKKAAVDGDVENLTSKLSDLISNFSELPIIHAFGVIRDDVLRMALLNMLIIIGRFISNLLPSAEKDEGMKAVTTLVTLVGVPQATLVDNTPTLQAQRTVL